MQNKKKIKEKLFFKKLEIYVKEKVWAVKCMPH